MALSDAATAILDAVERSTSRPVELHPDPKLAVPARVRMARGEVRSHVATYNPSMPTAEYWIAFEAGFILRLYATAPADRFLFAETGLGAKEISRIARSTTLKSMQPSTREAFLASLHAGLLTQLRSQPIGMRVNEWLWHDHPGVRNAQIEGIAAEQRQAAQTLAPHIRAAVPEKVFKASCAMNAAVAVFSDRLLGRQQYAIPFEAAGFLREGEELLRTWETIPSDPQQDRKRVDAWGEALGMSSWYKWAPLEA